MSLDSEIAQSVARHGWHAVNISDAVPPFVYTCGLTTTFRHPELVVFGLEPRTAHTVLATMVEQVRQGKLFAHLGVYGGVLEGFDVAVRSVHPTQHEFHLGYAMGHHRHVGNPGDLTAMQVFWPDRDGRFPFQAGCAEDVWLRQPRLDLEVAPSEIRSFRRQYEG